MNRNHANLLLDFYGSLLTNHQRDVLEAYYKDDLSMNEIAESFNISKAAVSDLINRATSTLEDYENKIGFISQTSKIEDLINNLKDSNNPDNAEIINKLEKIIRS